VPLASEVGVVAGLGEEGRGVVFDAQPEIDLENLKARLAG